MLLTYARERGLASALCRMRNALRTRSSALISFSYFEIRPVALSGK